MRVFGLPIQFVAVVVVSLLLTVYLMAAVANSRVESRTEANSALYGAPGGEAGSQAWESAVLYVCPLH